MLCFTSFVVYVPHRSDKDPIVLYCTVLPLSVGSKIFFFYVRTYVNVFRFPNEILLTYVRT